MGYNSKCSVQNCAEGCCNYYGTCPDKFFSSSNYNSCYYYYEKTNDVGGITGGSVGAVVGVVAIIIIICCCIKKHRQKKAREQQKLANAGNVGNKNKQAQNQLNMTTQHLATEIGNPNQLFMQGNQPFGQPMGQPYMQPSIAQPGAYGQPMPYGQPMAYDQPLYPPIAPNGMVNGPPGMYNPNPVIM